MSRPVPSPASDALTLRDATSGDAARLFEWANDPATRAASLSTAPIAWDEHVAWLEAKLASGDAHLYVAACEHEHVGQVRFEALDDASARISVLVAPGARGRGLAATMIDTGVARFFAHDRRSVVVAEIRASNAPSRAAFARAGFVERRPTLAPDGELVHTVVRFR